MRSISVITSIIFIYWPDYFHILLSTVSVRCQMLFLEYTKGRRRNVIHAYATISSRSYWAIDIEEEVSQLLYFFIVFSLDRRGNLGVFSVHH